MLPEAACRGRLYGARAERPQNRRYSRVAGRMKLRWYQWLIVGSVAFDLVMAAAAPRYFDTALHRVCQIATVR